MEARSTGATHASGGIVLRRVLARVVDDGLLTALSILVAVAVGRLIPTEAGFRTTSIDGSGFVDFGPPAAILLTGFLSTAIFVVYIGTASARDGRTLGRALTGLRVVASSGRPAAPAMLFGRELTRVFFVCLALAVIAPLAGVLATTFVSLSPDRAQDPFSLTATTITALVPIGIVVAGYLGLTLLDQQGRAPHDRLARSAVVRTDRADLGPSTT